MLGGHIIFLILLEHFCPGHVSLKVAEVLTSYYKNKIAGYIFKIISA